MKQAWQTELNYLDWRTTQLQGCDHHYTRSLHPQLSFHYARHNVLYPHLLGRLQNGNALGWLRGTSGP
jgi:hypothetical protein